MDKDVLLRQNVVISRYFIVDATPSTRTGNVILKIQGIHTTVHSFKAWEIMSMKRCDAFNS